MEIDSTKFVFYIEDYEEYSKRELQALLIEYKLLVIRNAALDYQEFNVFAELFGEPEIAYPYKFQAPGFETIRLQSNVEGRGMDGGGMYWHSDGPQSEIPSRITVLSCDEAPEKGGETAFCDLVSVYCDLPEEIKERIELLEGEYPCKQIYVDDLTEMGLEPEKDKVAELHDLKHPLVQKHPLTGTKALYLNEMWLKRIADIPKEESDTLLRYLYEFATQEKYLFTHNWQKHDMLVWDNYSLMHRALSLESHYPKTTKRIRIKG